MKYFCQKNKKYHGLVRLVQIKWEIYILNTKLLLLEKKTIKILFHYKFVIGAFGDLV